jgi:hypothetical protein
MPDLKVIIKSTDKKIKLMCEEYWAIEIDEKGPLKWMYYLKDLQEKYSLRQGEYLNIVSRNSYAFNPAVDHCEQCGDIFPIFKKRGDVDMNQCCSDNRINGKSLCYDCFNNALRANEEQLRVIRENDEEKYLEEIALSYENSAYESLTNLELRYLLELAKQQDPGMANRTIGISSSDSLLILEKLFEKKLINRRYHELPIIPDYWAEKLAGFDITKKVKTVFGSDKEKELYKLLKGQLLSVFPQMAVCSFIPKEAVQHLFLKDWHKDYYKCCRVDLVVMEQQTFIPQYVIEYQGGSHEDPLSMQRDQFKKMIIQEAELNVIYIDNKKLNHLKSKGDYIKFPEYFI